VRAKDGDLLAFAVLLESYEPRVMSLCLRLLRYEAESQLVVQDTFLTAWRRLESLPADTGFKAWILRLAAHRCIFVMRNRAERPASKEYRTEEGQSMSDSAEESLQSRASREVHRLDALLVQLPVEDHLTWLLHEIDGQSLAEIAVILDVSEAQVRRSLQRARSVVVEGIEGRSE